MIKPSNPAGAVSVTGDGQIRGWALDRANPGLYLSVIVLLDGEFAGFTRADRPSSELQAREAAPQSGGASTTHGFVCTVAAHKLEQACLLTVLAETPAGLALVTERVLRAPPALLDPRRSLAVHFDVSDLLEFLSQHREVTGIQRVQCGYLANALDMPEDLFSLRVCAQLPGRRAYVEIGQDAARTLLRGIAAPPTLAPPHTSLQAWRAQVEIVREGTGTAPDFQQGDILLTMGAPWVHEGYFRAIEAARRDHGISYIQIFYDLIPIMAPDSVASGMIGAFHRAMAGMLGCADHLLSISEHSAQDLRQACAALDVACPPISVIPLGATLDYRADGEGILVVDAAAPRLIEGGYVLCVGTLEPRKNHIYLYDIWKRMLDEGRTDVPTLVCVGRMGWQMEDLQRRMKVSDNLDGHFVHLSGIGDADLQLLYRDCLFTVFPSLYEGWGLPVAESLLFGKLCVSSGTTSMPEVGGDFAVYIDPYNLGDGYRVITGLLDDRGEVARLEARLRQDYVPLTWQAATTRLFDAVAAAHAAGTDAGSGAGLPPLVADRVAEFSTRPSRGGPLAGLSAEIARRAALRLLHGPDWHLPEPWGSWSCGQVARLGFAVNVPHAAPEQADLVCYLVLRLPSYANRTNCLVRIDGADMGIVTLSPEQDSEVRLDLPYDGSGDRLCRIDLELPGPLIPPLGADPRLLGIGVCRLLVCAAANRPVRLAYFERQLLVAGEITKL